MSTATTSPEQPSLRYRTEDFAHPLGDCDMIMKGGVTSGIVYPYTVLEIAKQYRLRGLGGTSAGAIAAAFAAGAEFARRNGDLGGFKRLQERCEELPRILLSLFQPDRELNPTVKRLYAAYKSGGIATILPRLLTAGALVGVLIGILGWAWSRNWVIGLLAGLLAAILAFGVAVYGNYVRPIHKAWKQLPDNGFGICSGLSNSEGGPPALTEWLHDALQYIAYGDTAAGKPPLTFRDLTTLPTPDAVPIELMMVTTNLSMRRPHTLPDLGVRAGFDLNRWKELFPPPIIEHLKAKTTPWPGHASNVRLMPGAKPSPDAAPGTYPEVGELPVLVGVRMSLSFPLLFSAVDLLMEDTELPETLAKLGAERASGAGVDALKRVTFSDGGLSSNFPIHLFDSPLPTRPTFAISLEELPVRGDKVRKRVAFPGDATETAGVMIKELSSVKEFGWQLVDSAKDWQDQLMSELTGQRERVVRVYLTSEEGGLNLDMDPNRSRTLMDFGLEAGQEFCKGSESGGFDFDEHRWHRLVVLYDHLDRMLTKLDQVWTPAYHDWFDTYRAKVKSYGVIDPAERENILETVNGLVGAYRGLSERYPIKLERRDETFPKKRGKMGIGPKY
ncbi:patatin [Altererythrobacter salegens]|uniref:Patatin n=1 Tax=Croceibacterium salegens TaxID=1737568 RepID=A0A6I4SVD9_9SPHN|nr:patatin-like phospholipase family protein [Croceibacterium salegens]MXO59020.1 patatin [Croceibacterium salegens]